jgi:hypothetical protein
MVKLRRLPLLSVITLLLILGSLYAYGPVSAAAPAARPQRAVESAWEQAADLGRYTNCLEKNRGIIVAKKP